MADINLTWDPVHYRGDWSCTSGDLAIDPGGLKTAVILCLFTNKRAPPGYTPPAGSPPDLYGYWGDTYEDFQLGSLLWTLNRAVKSDAKALLLQVQDLCLDALEWLVTANIVASVTVKVAWLTPTTVGIEVVITQPQSLPTTFNFAWSWQGILIGGNSTNGYLSPPSPSPPTLGTFILGQSVLV